MEHLHEFTADLGDEAERNAQVAAVDWDFRDAKKADQSLAIAMLHDIDYFTDTPIKELWQRLDLLADLVDAHEHGLIEDTDELKEAALSHHEALSAYLCKLTDLESAD